MLHPPARTRRFTRAEPDERLVARVRAGDREAFEAIYERYAPGLVSFCRHLLGSLEEAEDAVQHTFIAAHRSMLADDRELHLKAWLYAIARNRSLSMLRGRRERPGLDDEAEAGPATAGLASEVEQREDLRALLGDLARLPDDQRAALLLAELGAHTHDEIAEVLEVRRDKVKALVFQAREGLIAAREARETPCADIREQLASARGGALRRGNLRRHLESCEGCRAFRAEVQRQRAALAIILPVVPSLALKHAVLGGVAAGAAGFGGPSGAGGLGAAGGKAAATKLMAVLALAGGAGGTSYVAVHELDRHGTLPVLSAAAGPTSLPRAHAKPVALRVPRTPEITATPLREIQPPRAHRPARRRAHRARPAAPRTTFAAVKTKHPARPRHHAKRHHKRRGRGGREADAAPVVVSQGPQPAQPPPQPAAPAPAPMPAAPADDEGGDDQGKKGKGHHKHKHGDRGRHQGHFKQEGKAQPPLVVPPVPEQAQQPGDGGDDHTGLGHRTHDPGHRDERRKQQQNGGDG
jgi:RNA polymerase sigma factor (sigma-70 family)